MAKDPTTALPKLDALRAGVRVLELLPTAWPRLNRDQRVRVLRHLEGLADHLRGIGLALDSFLSPPPPPPPEG